MYDFFVTIKLFRINLWLNKYKQLLSVYLIYIRIKILFRPHFLLLFSNNVRAKLSLY